jgi:hypothetical protein
MGISEQYTDDRLDRLAGDIRDEAASRREETSELRTELRDETRALRKELLKELAIVWVVALLFSLFMFYLSLLADDADAAVRPSLNRSARVLSPTEKGCSFSGSLPPSSGGPAGQLLPNCRSRPS